jgi:hypothetical protein
MHPPLPASPAPRPTGQVGTGPARRTALAGLAAGAAGGAPPAPPQPAQPAPPQIEAPNPAPDLLRQLPAVANLVAHDGAVWWKGPVDSLAYPVVDIDQNNNPLIETEIGRITVWRRMVADERMDVIAALPALIARAKQGGVMVGAAAPELTLGEGPLTGIHLFAPQIYVLRDGVVRAAPLSMPDRGGDLQRLQQAVQDALDSLPTSPLTPLARQALASSLRQLTADDSGPDGSDISLQAIAPAQPSMLRRQVRSGWLSGVLGDRIVDQLATQVRASERFRPISLLEGPGMRLSEVRDAFGHDAWILTTPFRSSYMVEARLPRYYHAYAVGIRPHIVVDLPAGSDPTAVNRHPLAARLYVDTQLVASWSQHDGFSVDKECWRRYMPDKGIRALDGSAATVCSDFLPPHILITALNGDVISLATETGVVTPSQDGSASESERVLAEAAHALPDAAHLDLIGEYLVDLVTDSPDARFPQLVGTATVHGDIDQTAAQTIATTSGGVIRGDAADLAELYQTIAERQGRAAYLMRLPGQTVMVMAEKKEDDNWHTSILQAAPPTEFVDARLSDSLTHAYRSLDQGQPFDADAMPLLVRFPHAALRSPEHMSWRVFSDPEYAKAMDDITRDAHDGTVKRAIEAVTALFRHHDSDAANAQVLATLFRSMGQADLAVRAEQLTLDRTDSPEGRLIVAIGVVEALVDARRIDEAKALATRLLDADVPALRTAPQSTDRLAGELPALGTRLAEQLVRGGAYSLATRTLRETGLDQEAAAIERLAPWLNDPHYSRAIWQTSPELVASRLELRRFVAVATDLLQGLGPDALPASTDLQAIARCAQEWLNRVAFHDYAIDDRVLDGYTMAGQFYSAVIGGERLQALVEGADLPRSPVFNHLNRIGGLAQLQIDLPWIRLSVAYWLTGMQRVLAASSPDHVDLAQLQHLGDQLGIAASALERLGLADAGTHADRVRSAVILGLLSRDADRLHRLFADLAAGRDEHDRAIAADCLGSLARLMPIDWFAQAAAIWQRDLATKDAIDRVAWTAVRHGASQQGLLLSQLAAVAYADDPAMVEEADFMKRVVANGLAFPDLSPAPIPPPAAPPAGSGAGASPPQASLPGTPGPLPDALAGPAPGAPGLPGLAPPHATVLPGQAAHPLPVAAGPGPSVPGTTP